ncbi:MAG: GspMb/PilO family protein [Chthoniobacteraceae bacterium]
MSAKLSKRETILATAVGVVVFLVLNVVVIQYFLKNRARLQIELATKTTLLAKNQERIASQPMWKERDEWLKKTLPKLENEGTAGGDLLNEIRDVATKTSVQALEPQIGTVERRPQMTAVFVTIQTKATKEALRNFLYEIQAPERSIVFESSNLQFDKTDKTQMHGTFRIAKWFAPR